MEDMDYEASPAVKSKIQNMTAEALRTHLLEHSKGFKTSWINLGQALYQTYRDKLYHAWGHESFEDYTVNELGLKKAVALRLVKTYFFVEQQEPAYLKKEYSEARDANVVPSYEALDVLRLAKKRKELDTKDYAKLRKDVFENGKDASLVRKDLTAMIKERKEVDPDEEREKRNVASVKRFMTALRAFKKDMEALKLISPEIVEEAEELLKRLEQETM